MWLLLKMLAGFAFGFFGSIPLAGPIALLVLHRGLQKDYRSARLVALGGSVAEGLYCLLAVLGLEVLLQAYPQVEFASKLVGAVLFLGLGILFLVARLGSLREAPNLPQVGKSGPFLLGLMVAGLNPTLLLTWSAVATALRGPLGGFSRIEQVGFSVAVATGVYLWFVAMLWLMERHQHRLDPKKMAVVVKIFGVIIGLIGIWSLVSLLR